jgi:hypothetical protein
MGNALEEMDGKLMEPLLPLPPTLMVQVVVEILPVNEMVRHTHVLAK